MSSPAEGYYRLLVFGSRTWTLRGVLYGQLNQVRDQHPRLLVVHGAARGADMMADQWRTTMWRSGATVMVERVPARWRVQPRGPLDRGAGHARNARMAGSGIQGGLGFACQCRSPRCARPGPHPTHGSEGAIELLAERGIPCRIITDSEALAALHPGWHRAA